MSTEIARAFAPGRVNLIGEHTDYNDGLALPFAITQGLTVTATREAGQSSGEDASAFVRGAFAVLRDSGYEVPDAKVQISSDLPQEAGLGSSAALTIALLLALIELAGATPPTALELARLGQRIEQEEVGADIGLLDQLASLSGSAGHATLIDFRTFAIEPIPLQLHDHTLVVLASGQAHANAASGYNRRRQECTEAAHRMGAQMLRDAYIQDLHMLPDELARRARHVIGESGRVLGAAAALRHGDLELLGQLLDVSHASLRDDFEVSTPAVEQTVRALKDSGALGARLIGGGFGGSVLALMPPGKVAPAGATVVIPGPGAHLLVP